MAKENNIIGERIKAARRGYNTAGHAPLGYQLVSRQDGDRERKVLEIDPDTAPIVQQIFHEYAAGKSSYEIAVDLDSAGIMSSTGKRWNAAVLRHMLTNRKYIGELVYGKRASYLADGKVHVKKLKLDQCTICEEACPAIIDRETWNQVQERLGGPRRSGRFPKKFFLLGGIIRCWCGSHMTCDGRYQRYYRCRSTQIRRGCEYACHTRAEILEEAVMKKLLKILKGLCVESEIRKYIQEEPRQNSESELKKRKKELEEIERGIRNLLNLAQYGQAVEEIQGRIGDLARRKEVVIAEMQKLEQENGEGRLMSAGLLIQQCNNMINMLKYWEGAHEEVRDLLRKKLKIRYNGRTGHGMMSLALDRDVAITYTFRVNTKNRR